MFTLDVSMPKVKATKVKATMFVQGISVVADKNI